MTRWQQFRLIELMDRKLKKSVLIEALPGDVDASGMSKVQCITSLVGHLDDRAVRSPRVEQFLDKKLKGWREVVRFGML